MLTTLKMHFPNIFSFLQKIIMHHIHNREIRAYFNNEYIRVYQAYSDEVANSIILNNSFASSLFKMNRMTWIKPSFLWMMYRANWGRKDCQQKRILAIDISHDGFLWLLDNSCLSTFDPKIYSTMSDWKLQLAKSPVNIQWDPERNILLDKLDYKTIQIGLSGQAVFNYVHKWVIGISDITSYVEQIRKLIESSDLDSAIKLLPNEQPYPLSQSIAKNIAASSVAL